MFGLDEVWDDIKKNLAETWDVARLPVLVIVALLVGLATYYVSHSAAFALAVPAVFTLAVS